MKNHRRVWILPLLLSVALPLSSSQEVAGQDEQNTGRLDLRVMVVADDLSLRPVPKHQFTVSFLYQGGAEREIVTSFSGEASVELREGAYRITSASPLSFEGKSFLWEVEFDIQAGETTLLELSNDNAKVEVNDETSGRDVELTEEDLYRKFKDSVFKVIAEAGHGSGFLVGREGLIVTNHHVVRDSDYIAVKTDNTSKFPGRVVAEDSINDIAVVWINPSAVEDRPVLELVEDQPDVAPVSVGERVLAIGSPLATETILTSGLVSKVEEGVIYSDVSINPGNSGGPLFSKEGHVIGINTFGLLSSGPGVSGIVRIHLASRVIEEARSSIHEQEAPELRRLPVEPSFRFPAERLREVALSENPNPLQYHVEAGKFDVQVVTPVLIAALEVAEEKKAHKRRGKRNRRKKGKVKELEAGEGFYEWRQYAGDYRAVVRLQATPEIRLTTGSALAVGFLGANVPKQYRFKSDFDRMELLRNHTRVEPIHPGRRAQVVNVDAGLDSLDDVGFYGSYTYPPEAFKPGAILTLKVWKQGVEKPIVKNLNPKLVNRVWQDFAPYFESLEQEVGKTGGGG